MSDSICSRQPCARVDPAWMQSPRRPQLANEHAVQRQGPLRPPAAPRPLEQLPAQLNLRVVHEHRNPAPRRNLMLNDGWSDPTRQERRAASSNPSRSALEPFAKNSPIRRPDGAWRSPSSRRAAGSAPSAQRDSPFDALRRQP